MACNEEGLPADLADLRANGEGPWSPEALEEDAQRLADFERARMGMPWDKVRAWMESWGTPNELPTPKPAADRTYSRGPRLLRCSLHEVGEILKAMLPKQGDALVVLDVLKISRTKNAAEHGRRDNLRIAECAIPGRALPPVSCTRRL